MIATGRDRLIEAIRYQTEKVTIICNDTYMLPDLAVHEIRKAFKRLVAFLKFAPAELDKTLSDFSSQIKVLARKLTEAREAAVNLMLYDRLLETDAELPAQRKEELKYLLEADKNGFVEQLFEEEKILADISALMLRMQKVLLPQLHKITAPVEIIPRLMTSYEKAFSHFSRLQGSYDPVMYHELRKLLKTLYYQFELATAGQEAAFLPDSEELDRLTERLGEDHDWYIFQLELSKDLFRLTEEEFRIIGKQIRNFMEPNFNFLIPALEDFFLNPDNNFIDKLDNIRF